MKLTESELASLFRRGTERSDSEREQCLDAETIAALTAGELEELRRDEAFDHLSSCSECAEEVRMLAPLEQWSARVSGAPQLTQPAQGQRLRFSRPAAFALAASLLLPLAGVVIWQRMEMQRLHETLDHAPVVRARRSPATQTEPVVTPDLAPRVAELEAELTRMSQPQLNPLIVDLEPDALRGGAAPNVIDVPRDAAFFNVILTSDASHPAYALEVRSESGGVIWRGSGLRRGEYGTFTAALPTRLVSRGRYELRLYGLNGSRERLLQRYHLRVTSN